MAVISRLARSTTSTFTNSFIIPTIISRKFTSSSLSSETTLHSPSSWNDTSNNSNNGSTPLKLREGRDVHWVFLGCPGVGKGTYATRLSKLLDVPHISTGDLVRDELASSGSLSPKIAEIVNSGKLLSDEIIVDLLSKRLEAGEARGESGFILDGFPRTVRQAAVSLSCLNVAGHIFCSATSRIYDYSIRKHAKLLQEEILEGVIDIDLVVNLKLREEALLAKCLGRRICSQCGGNYNVACIDIKGDDESPGMYMAPLLPPAECASKLVCRADDKEEVVKERLRIYDELTRPVEEFYRKRGKLLQFDLPGGIPESWPKLLHALNLDDHEDDQSAAA